MEEKSEYRGAAVLLQYNAQVLCDLSRIMFLPRPYSSHCCGDNRIWCRHGCSPGTCGHICRWFLRYSSISTSIGERPPRRKVFPGYANIFWVTSPPGISEQCRRYFFTGNKNPCAAAQAAFFLTPRQHALSQFCAWATQKLQCRRSLLQIFLDSAVLGEFMPWFSIKNTDNCDFCEKRVADSDPKPSLSLYAPVMWR